MSPIAWAFGAGFLAAVIVIWALLERGGRTTALAKLAAAEAALDAAIKKMDATSAGRVSDVARLEADIADRNRELFELDYQLRVLAGLRPQTTGDAPGGGVVAVQKPDEASGKGGVDV